jgi:hypothetical protein
MTSGSCSVPKIANQKLLPVLPRLVLAALLTRLVLAALLLLAGLVLAALLLAGLVLAALLLTRLVLAALLLLARARIGLARVLVRIVRHSGSPRDCASPLNTTQSSQKSCDEVKRAHRRSATGATNVFAMQTAFATN